MALVDPGELARRAINQSGTLRRIVKSGQVQHLIQTERAARALQPVGRFLAGQQRRDGVGAYTLRATGTRVHLRHGTRDVHIFNEIFGSAAAAYEPPAEAELRLRGPIRVADVGANVGLFGVYAAGRWDVQTLHSFEPDPSNLELLAATVASHPLGDRWTVSPVAVSNCVGSMPFVAGRFSESRRATSEEDSIDVPMVDFFDAVGSVDLLKIDIEGGEWRILDDPRFAALDAAVVVMEWHTVGSSHADPHAAARAALTDAGLVQQHETPAPHGSNGVIWAWR
ncbi:MAG TPA: FkbM family methyltransferase [Baekduia sp.]|uniref:FkbM family methyltransferase n=1 Tax=Baekduia sp. TaxID=2600305 RepID=UPI002C5AC551|nr:FkbM family methyltransferase [Baekduia sp.]HMJ33987.1 FkbM family methyltransferase [Baekduia sp.]